MMTIEGAIWIEAFSKKKFLNKFLSYVHLVIDRHKDRQIDRQKKASASPPVRRLFSAKLTFFPFTSVANENEGLTPYSTAPDPTTPIAEAPIGECGGVAPT